ncbi:unnamed protein product [Brassica oleracea var. botrytis]
MDESDGRYICILAHVGKTTLADHLRSKQCAAPEASCLMLTLYPSGEITDESLELLEDDEESSILPSQPKSTVGTPAYIAPGILLRQEYDGKDLNLSPECRHLISRILVADPATIISIPDIKFHEWFLKNQSTADAEP